MNPEKKELYTAKRSSGLDVSDPDILEKWSQIKDDSNPLKFLLG